MRHVALAALLAGAAPAALPQGSAPRPPIPMRRSCHLVGVSLARGFPVGAAGTALTVRALLRPRFQVNFTDQFGVLDDTRIEVNLTRGALFGGATWAVARGLGLSGEIYGAPGDAVTGRIMASYALRRVPVEFTGPRAAPSRRRRSAARE